MAIRTPLYEEHIALGGRMTDFGGYELPVRYSGIIEEHNAVRNAAGLFDVSHMAEISIRGPKALDLLRYVCCSDMSELLPGGTHYSPITNDEGGIVDDVLVYCLAEEDYLMVANASNRHKVYSWLCEHNPMGAEVADLSDSYAQVALQGPAAIKIVALLCAEENIPQKYYSFINNVKVGEFTCLLSRTGYTGEDGFEMYTAAENAVGLWRLLLETGKEFGILPCALGARDTLRFEASMPLYGHELRDDISPLEAGLSRFVDLDRDYIGSDALKEQKSAGLTRRRCGLELTDRGIAREGCKVYLGEEEVGFVTSGTMSPTLGKALAMAYVKTPYNKKGTELTIDVRGRRIAAKAVPMPFYKANK